MTTPLTDVTEPRDDDAFLYAFRRNVVVAASAGTGKTYRLTALYVLLVLGLTSMGERDHAVAAPPIGPHRILATTFSRAAAREIATRVEQALREVATWDGTSALGLDSGVLGASAATPGRGPPRPPSFASVPCVPWRNGPPRKSTPSTAVLPVESS